MPITLKRSFHLILVSTLILLVSELTTATAVGQVPEEGIRTVVIDAGHGGHDPGGVGKRAKEKDLALAIALKVGHYIEENMPEVKVIYTRKTDVYVELWKRAEIANTAGADLFISIHVNALPQASANGTLTLVLGQHRSDENFDVAVKENSVILLEDNYETIYEGFDPESTESYIMFSLMQKTYFRQSIEFGDYVQEQFRERARRKDLGVREQGLMVLARTTMPGVLIETGFITNQQEETYLMSEYGQDIIASAIYRGFRNYKEEIDNRSQFASIVRKTEPEEEVIENEPVLFEIPEGQIVFSIQIASSKNKIPTEPSSFKGVEGVNVIEDGRWYKYMVGMEIDYHSALEKCQDLKNTFPDAFVVASKDGKLMPLGDALAELNR